ncbi:uncharacterized protein EI90DRAFT_3011525 [Cantharellus anzutake]|uniref:uncharacterized protein n=1 Tax=Cantharellus anzutake TaxID=1750568 RepID=UPI001908D141|nr:uncharacterized protein EI90DRAFT_3011525 [Cantharellus anzutake]KAF8343150.1 hypothetical protein EI90DRAFT_3011525 [Cantharellus anzutake]
MAMSSSNDFTPPSSAFPSIAQWLGMLEANADFNPNQLCFTQYVSEINEQGYHCLDELQNKGLCELGVDIPPGLSEKLGRAMQQEVRKFLANLDVTQTLVIVPFIFYFTLQK